jgi:hypothetical protein
MTTLTAHFDGHVIVPDTPVSLPVNQPLRVSVILLAPGAENGYDVDEITWMRATAAEAANDFLAEEPDIYSSSDGRPFHKG